MHVCRYIVARVHPRRRRAVIKPSLTGYIRVSSATLRPIAGGSGARESKVAVCATRKVETRGKKSLERTASGFMGRELCVFALSHPQSRLLFAIWRIARVVHEGVGAAQSDKSFPHSRVRTR